MHDLDDDIEHEVLQHATLLGAAIHDERVRRAMSMTDLARAARLSLTTIHNLESGRIGSFETYIRVGRILKLRREFALVQGRRTTSRPQDPVHAAMGEIEAAHFRGLGFDVGVDEPYQHFQFAGRVDVAVWSRERRALLAIENRTQFPNVGETAGSFNAKCAYFGREFVERAGVTRWASETHVIVALWSAEVLHEIRLRRASFDALCPDDAEPWTCWWSGEPPPTGRRRSLLVFDPLEGRRRDRARWASGDEIATVRPRYRNYADTAAALRDDGRG